MRTSVAKHGALVLVVAVVLTAAPFISGGRATALTELASNAGFEANMTGWAAGSGATAARTTAQAHSGSAAAEITRTSGTGEALLNDSPNTLSSSTTGHTCFASAWVKGPSGKVAEVRLREYSGGVQQGYFANAVTLNGSWQHVVTSLDSSVGGEFDLNVYGQSFAANDKLYVDDVSLTCQAYNTAIDFNDTLLTLGSLSIGADITGYGAGSYITNDSAHNTALTNLNLNMARMELAYEIPGDPTSDIVCGGAGCDTTVSGDDWVNSIRSIGATPVIIVPMDATDAANMVDHFLDTDNRVSRWIIGNEASNISDYAADFNDIYDAMKAVDPTIKVGGPGWAWYDHNAMETFLEDSGSRVDFIDFHQYGQGGSLVLTDAQLMAQTQSYQDNLEDLRALIIAEQPLRASQIEMQVGEYNMSWSSDSRLFSNFNTLWSASALGNILEGGGHALHYGDKVGELGLLYEADDTGHSALKNDPMPAYWGMAMFTGGNLFRHFGPDVVATTSSVSGVEIFASSNPKNVVVINSNNTAVDITTKLEGIIPGSIQIWRKDTTTSPIDAPAQVGTTSNPNNYLRDTLPANSVTTYIMP